MGWCRGGHWGGGVRALHGRGGVHLRLTGRHGLGLRRLSGVLGQGLVYDGEARSPTDGKPLCEVVVSTLILVHSGGMAGSLSLIHI